MIRIEGASERIVSSATNWSARSVTPAPWPKSSVSVWASAGAATAQSPSQPSASASLASGRSSADLSVR